MLFDKELLRKIEEMTVTDYGASTVVGKEQNKAYVEPYCVEDMFRDLLVEMDCLKERLQDIESLYSEYDEFDAYRDNKLTEEME